MAALDVTQKTEIYHTLYQLSSAFAAIVGHCETLRQSGMLKQNSQRCTQHSLKSYKESCIQKCCPPFTALKTTTGYASAGFATSGENTSEENQSSARKAPPRNGSHLR